MDFCSRTALALGAVLIASLPMPASTQISEDKPSSGLLNPGAIAASPLTHKVYAVDAGHASVEVYDDLSHSALSIHVGPEPVAVAVDAKTGRAYVANAGDGTVSVIDAASDKVVATIQVGSHPYSIAADAGSGKVYVTHTFSDQLTIIDGSTNVATDLTTGSSDLIAIDSKTGMIYLLGYGSAVKILDTATLKLTEHPVGKHAWVLAIDDVTGTVYVARIEDADIVALDSRSRQTRTFAAGAIPCAIAIDSQNNVVYVANSGDNTVSVIDGKTGATMATVAVGNRPEALAYDATRQMVYVANVMSNNITVIDAKSNNALATLPAGNSPHGLAIIPSSSRIYVANASEKQSSTVVDIGAIKRPTQ